MKSLLNAVTAPVTGNSVNPATANRTFQATVAGTGAVGATVIIECSNDDGNYLTLGTITLSGTTSASDGFVSVANWMCVRARLTAISGTGAAVSVAMGG
jgi:hypothetical protein